MPVPGLTLPTGPPLPTGRSRGGVDASHDRPESSDDVAPCRGHEFLRDDDGRGAVTRTSRWRRSTTTCLAVTVPRSSRSFTSRCRRRRTRGVTTRCRSIRCTAVFLAHEVAHQWWGQAVGWKNYHEQWISEGLAQYFAALYAGSDRGAATLDALLSAMRNRGNGCRKDPSPSATGSVTSRPTAAIFRSVVYNKSAVVLHMLRRLIGDDAFFNGLRKFYRDSRFQKAGTGDFRAAFETVTPIKLERFVDRWILGSTVPGCASVTSRDPKPGGHHPRRAGRRRLRSPLTVSVQYTDGRVRGRHPQAHRARRRHRIPTKGVVRRVVAKDELSLFDIVKSRVTVGTGPQGTGTGQTESADQYPSTEASMPESAMRSRPGPNGPAGRRAWI